MLRQNLALVLVCTLPLAAQAQKCRQPGKAYNLDQANLPLCKTKSAANSKGRKRLDEMQTTPEKWDELMNAEAMPDDKPERPQYQAPVKTRVPAAATATRPATATSRNPASVANTGVRNPASIAPAAARVAPLPAAFPVANLTFEDYVAENARNPALSTRIPDHQKAFADTSGPAVITIPGSDSEKAQLAAEAAATSAAAAPAGATPGVPSTAAIQAAAAAAGYVLPAATGTSTTAPAAAPAAGGPVR
jgi:hypothetical protein